ncbi:MAG: glycoside hydrolase family 3 N-terminal domain-containing protein [Vampirovibrionales bacterium]
MNAHDFQTSLESIVARCMFGFDAAMFAEDTEAFQLANLNPLGYIFFRHHFDECTSLDDLESLLDRVKARHPHPLFLGLDQEGGQVERLPSHLFHGGISPFTVGEVERLTPETELAKRYYDWQSKGLASLGFNLNFFPTLDAHLNPQNPIIGNRAFSSDPTEIKRLGRLAIDAQSTYGIQSVLKHYPGHGNGTVDSHLALPTLTFSEAEESSFVDLMQVSPTTWLMLAHGVYPRLQGTQTNLPASCDKGIVTERLRQHWGFKGITITDDLNMQGLLDAFHGDQIQASLTALNAGVDVLLFREAGKRELEIVEALAHALVDGRLDLDLHEASLARLAEARTVLSSPLQQPDVSTLESIWHQTIEALHETTVNAIFADAKGVLNLENTLVIEPLASLLPHYAMEYEKGSLTQRFLPEGATVYAYDETDMSALSNALNTHHGDVLTVVWLPHIGKSLLDALNLRQASRETASSQTVVLNIGTPVEGVYTSFKFINLGTARPPTIQKALARLFA